MKTIARIAAAAAMITASAAQAQTVTPKAAPVTVERHTVVSTVKTSMIATVCRAESTPNAADMCSGYILGAFDAASIAGAICPGATVNTVDVLTMGRTALLTPGADVLTPSTILGNVFRKTWPCN